MHLHILAEIVGPCLFHSPTDVIWQYTFFSPSLWWICTCLLVIIWDVGQIILLIIYTKIIDNQGEIDWVTAVCPLSRGFALGILSIRWQVLYKGIVCDSSCLWESIHSIGYSCEHVSGVNLVLDIVCNYEFLWDHGYLYHYIFDCWGKDLCCPCTCITIWCWRWQCLHAVSLWLNLIWGCWLILDSLWDYLPQWFLFC